MTEQILTDENQVVFNKVMRRILQDMFELEQIVPDDEQRVQEVDSVLRKVRETYNPIPF